MKRAIFPLFFLITFASAGFAQTSFRATVAEGSKQLIMETKTTGPAVPALVGLLSDKGRYSIYRLSIDIPEKPTSTPLDFDALTDGAIFCNAGTGFCLVNLRNAIPVGNYVIKVNGLGAFASNASEAVQLFGLKPPGPIAGAGPTTTATIVSSIDGRRNKVRVQSKADITANAQLNVVDTTLRISADKTRVQTQDTTISADVENPQSPVIRPPAPRPAKSLRFCWITDWRKPEPIPYPFRTV